MASRFLVASTILLGQFSACDAFSTAGIHAARRSCPAVMSLGPNERWDNYKAAAAVTKSFQDAPSVDTALDLCRSAAKYGTDTEPDAVVEALLTVEKSYRSVAKDDGGALSRETLANLNGAWRLVFTTGTVETQSKLGRKINYFPLRATQTFDTSTMAITNGIFLGDFAVLKFFGSFDWLEERRRLEFDFDAIALAGFKFDLPKGGAEKLGAATGLGAENNVKRAEVGKKAFFNWISADDAIATARGGGGGLALWRRDVELESRS